MASSVQATTVAAYWWAAISLARFGPLITAIRSGAGDLGDHLAHPQVGAVLDALHQADEQRAGRQQPGPAVQVLAQRLGGHGKDDQIGPRQRRRRVAGR